MTCAELDRWIDEGMAEGRATEARIHAASCARCAEALAAAYEIDGLLASEPAAVAPPGFTEHVMARVAEVSRTSRPVVAASALPWWIDAVAQPVSVLVAAVAALMVWQWDALIAAGLDLSQALSSHPMSLGEGLARLFASLQLPEGMVPSFQQTDVRVGIALVVLPATAWCAWWLYRRSARLFASIALRGPRPLRG